MNTLEHTYFLDVPWDQRALLSAFGGKWDKELKSAVYKGVELPVQLRDMQSQPFSYERWHEDRYNKKALPIPTKNAYTLRPHQKEGVNKIVQAIKQGYRGFILADETGLGKTLISLYGAYAQAQARGFTPQRRAKVLIVATKSALPHWRGTIINTKLTTLLDIMLVNYDILKRLLDAPAAAKKAKTKRTADRIHARSGTPNIKWDIIIADESHKLKNNSQRRSSFEKIARYADGDKTAPFIMWLSATIGQNPIELAYLSPIVAQLRGKKNSSVKGWEQFLTEEKFSFSKGKAGDLNWVRFDPKDSAETRKEKRSQMTHDLNKIKTLLFSPNSPSIRRSPEDIRDYPRIQRIPAPIDLSLIERVQYEKAWSEFVIEHKIMAKMKDPVGALAIQTRLRQKTSIIKAPHTVSQVEDLLENGYQVLVSVLYKDTAEKIAEILGKKGIKSIEYTGRIPAETGEREQNRIMFQKGQVPVIIFSVTESVSLHAGELLADGSNASSANRALVVHDLRYSSLDAVQIEGRGHRDGKASNAYYPYLNHTVEGKILPIMLERMKNTKHLSGDSTDDIAAVKDLYDKLVLH